MRNQLAKGLMGWMLSASMVLGAGPFVAPSEGPVPFRRDRVPLDIDTMNGLSRHILLISKTLKLESNIERRTAAQGIAVALALDPSNREARDLSAQLVDEKAPIAPETEEVESAKSSVWKILAWLESSESGLDGQKLGECLTDVMAVTDSSNPRSKAYLESGSSGEWDGWIPALAAYDKSEKVTPPEIPQVEPSGPNEGKKSELLRNEAVVSTPLWTFDKDTDKTVLKSVKISMKAFLKEEEEFSEEPKEFRFIVEGTEDEDSLRTSCRPVISALRKMGDRLPSNGRVSLIAGKDNDYLVHRNRLSISAALAVLGDAAVSGREPNATVMGIVAEDGALKLPTHAWGRLRILSNGPGGRLVLPRAAEALLPSILAMEDPAFFIKYEVILADNLKELVEFSAKGGNGPLADASNRFAEIRSKMGTMPVAQYVANRFVRQRLNEIAQACPNHMSARMLSIQGAGERPTRLPRNILAAEIRTAIEPISIVTQDWDQCPDGTRIEEIFESCRKRLDPLERYTDTRERELFAEARSLLTTMRTFGRIMRGRNEDDDSAHQVYDTLRAQHAQMRKELSATTGDEDPKDRGDR